MVLPNLIHPVPVRIQQIVTGDTMYDEDFREPIQNSKRSTTIVVPGQPKFTDEGSLSISEGGVRPITDGHIIFRYIDLNRKSITLSLNDRFVKIGHVVCDLYIVRLVPVGEYPEHNGPTMVKAYFVDRQPSRQSKGVVDGQDGD